MVGLVHVGGVDVHENVLDGRLLGRQAHLSTQDTVLERHLGGLLALHHADEVADKVVVSAKVTAAGGAEGMRLGDVLVVAIQLDLTSVEVKLDRNLIADDIRAALGSAMAGDKVLGIGHVHAVVVLDDDGAAVLDGVILGVAAVLTDDVAVADLSDVLGALGAGLGVGAVLAHKAGGLVTLEHLLGFHGAHANGTSAAQQRVDVVQVVGGLLQKQTARDALVAIPLVVVAAGVGHVIDGLNVSDLTDLAALDELSGVADHAGGAKREGNDHAVVDVHNGLQSGQILLGRADRLFEEYGHVVLRDQHGVFGVAVAPCTDANAVELFGVHHLLGIVVVGDALPAKIVQKTRFSRFHVDIHDGGDLDLTRCHHELDQTVDSVTVTDNADIQHSKKSPLYVLFAAEQHVLDAQVGFTLPKLFEKSTLILSIAFSHFIRNLFVAFVSQAHRNYSTNKFICQHLHLRNFFAN